MNKFAGYNTSIISSGRGNYQWIADTSDYSSWMEQAQILKEKGAKGADQVYLPSFLTYIPSWTPLGPKRKFTNQIKKRIKKKMIPMDAKPLVLSGKDNKPRQLTIDPDFCKCSRGIFESIQRRLCSIFFARHVGETRP